MKKAFTIIELLVAMGIIVILLAGSGYVFRTAVEAEQTARATAEIARKLRGITDQLNKDFQGLRFDGEMFFAWQPHEIKDSSGNVIGYERTDQLQFFANGNFTSYHDNPKITGNIARIQYMIARPDELLPPPWEPASPLYNQRNKWVLTRVQHTYSADTTLPPFPNLAAFDYNQFKIGQRDLEYDTITMNQWNNIDQQIKEQIYTITSGLIVDFDGDGLIGGVDPEIFPIVGAEVDTANSADVHKMFIEGVGEFIIQHWDQNLKRWYPEVDIDGDNEWPDLDGASDTDWNLSGGFLDLTNVRGGIHPADDTFFDNFGRALKFTFTLYDSYGVFPDGKTFSHIVYLD